MRLYFFASLFIVMVSQEVFGQSKPENENYWELLLQNKRVESLKSFQEQHIKKSLDNSLIEAIIKVENGQFNYSKEFINAIKHEKDFQYYLYAFWNSPFFFNEYLESGFENSISARLEVMELSSIENTTIRESLRYLKSIEARHNKNWDDYYRLNKQIPVIKDWQYCGSFENLNGSGINTFYEPEGKPISKEDFNANSNGKLNWYHNDYTEKEAYQFYINHSEYGNGVNYAQTFINLKNQTRAVLRVGTSSLIKVFINDVLVLENLNEGLTDLDAYNIEVTLPKGVSRILVKNAHESERPYFILRFTDSKGESLENLTWNSDFQDYNKSSIESISPLPLLHSVESFFLDKLKKDSENAFLKLCMINLYNRNSKYTESKEILIPWLKQNPKSSLLRKLMIECYTLENDESSRIELEKNILNDDKKYYLSYIYRLLDTEKLLKLPIAEFEKFSEELKFSTDNEVIQKSCDLFLSMRKQDIQEIKRKLIGITSNFDDYTKLMQTYISFFSNYLNEDDLAISTYEKQVSNYASYSALMSLVALYYKQNRKDDVLKLFDQYYDLLSWDNQFLFRYVDYLNAYKEYEQSIPIIEKALENYPYSFTAMNYMGTTLDRLNKKERALEFYRQSLNHDGANSAVRKKIEDLSNSPNYSEKLAIKSIYKFIADNRLKKITDNYGYSYLLEEAIVQLYQQGGHKYRYRYAIKISSSNGIETMKEIDLGLSGSYIITKSELIKPDGTIVPASEANSKIVFNNLKVDDVILIDYETESASSGRFFKDYVDYFQFDSYHPSLKTSYTLIAPTEKKVHHTVVNGDLFFSTGTLDDQVYYKWEALNVKELPKQEDYMPSMADISRYLHISTLDSWDQIATWYSDLVDKQMLINSDVQDAFNTIFKNAINSYSDGQKAEKIYYYLMKNLSYSYVSFKQSGFVPQKPSETLNSKLGDCKDFSALYVTLAEMAGLKSHLVLILTSGHGEKSIILPSQDFNHCIVKVFIDGKPQYLELTDNNLPYQSIPNSLSMATALDIPSNLVKTVPSGIYKLDNVQHVPTIVTSKMIYKIRDEEQYLNVQSTYEGAIKSNYSSIFKEKNFETIESSIYDDFKSRISQDFTLDSLYQISYDVSSPKIEYTSDLTLKEKIAQVGGTKVLRLPKVNNPYNGDIISEDSRNYPIDYMLYENAESYLAEYSIRLEKTEKFTDVPDDIALNYKKHEFNINYSLLKPNELFVKISANTPKERILPENYQEFKAYVKQALELKDRFIGYKTIRTNP